jgi:hypothetical protein
MKLKNELCQGGPKGSSITDPKKIQSVEPPSPTPSTKLKIKLKTQKWATDPKWVHFWGVLFCTPVFHFLVPGELSLGGLKPPNNYFHCLTLYNFRLRDRIRDYGNCQASSNTEEACICLEFSLCFACCPVPTRRGESGTDYQGPAIRKGARCLTMLHIFLSVLVLPLFVDYTN